jgi:hypothetical protein
MLWASEPLGAIGQLLDYARVPDMAEGSILLLGKGTRQEGVRLLFAWGRPLSPVGRSDRCASAATMRRGAAPLNDAVSTTG